MASSLRDVGAAINQYLLLAVPSWDYRDYVGLCSGCYDACRFLEISNIQKIRALVRTRFDDESLTNVVWAFS